MAEYDSESSNPRDEAVADSLKRIVIVQDLSREFGHALMRGVVKYIKPRYECQIDRVQLSPQNALNRILESEYDGVIAHIAGGTLRHGLPDGLAVVNTSNVIEALDYPRVTNDDIEAGRQVGRFLRQKGFQRCIFVGNESLYYSRLRREGLSEVMEKSVEYLELHGRHEDTSYDLLVALLREARLPVAVVGMDDDVASVICRAGRELDLAMPEDMAVIGFNNEELVCELCHPQISSMAMQWEQIGRKAAELLVRVVGGEDLRGTQCLLPPAGIVERQSTDASAIADPSVRTALERIRETHGCLSVEEAIEGLAISRRAFELKFREVLGRTPHDHILHERVKHAQNLLIQSSMSVTQIAMSSGFSSPTHMGSVFRRFLDKSPTEVRMAYGRDQAGS